MYKNNLYEQNTTNIVSNIPDQLDFADISTENAQGVPYVAGYILRKIVIPDKNCSICQNDLYSSNPASHHLFTSFKEYKETPSLIYASDQVVTLLENIHNFLYVFLEKCSYIKFRR